MKASLLILSLLILATHCKLLYLFSMVRHGAIYPKNDLYDGNQTKAFRGQLTSVGQRQQYNLGTYLQQNYITTEQLTTPRFNPAQVEFYASSYQRTQASALAFLYGLFPLQQGWVIPDGVTEDKFNPPYTPLFPSKLRKENQEGEFALNKGFQAMPVRPLDNILDNCPNYDDLLLIRKREVAAKVALLESQQALQIAKLKVLFNLTAAQATLSTMSDLHETLLADRYLGRPMPAQFDSNDQVNLKYMFDQYNTLIQGGNFAKVMITPTLRMLRQKLDSAAKKTTNNKLTSITCHSSNTWPLLTQLNLTSAECITQKYKGDPVTALNCAITPLYSSSLLFELHQDDSSSQLNVRVRYNGQYLNLCENRQTKCDYDDFVARLKATEVNYENECRVGRAEIVEE